MVRKYRSRTRRGTAGFAGQSDYEVDTKEPRRFEQFLSSSFRPDYRLKDSGQLPTVQQSKMASRFFSQERVQKDYATRYVNQSYNEKLEWKEKGVDPVTLNMPSEVYPYGGGLSPHRQMTKQELAVNYLGSRAVAQTIMQYKIDEGQANIAPQDAQLSRNRLIRGDYDEEFDETVPVIPYPVVSQYKGEETFRVGTVEEAVLREKRWWNKNVEGLQDRDVITENQKELTDEQVNAVWRKIQPEVNRRVGWALLKQDIGRERPVPSIRGSEPLIRKSDGTFEPAVHGFDFDGTINSARNQELTERIEQDLELADYNGETERAQLLADSLDRVVDERVIKPRWAMLATRQSDPNNPEKTETFEDVKRAPSIAQDNLEFWGMPLEYRDQVDVEERQDGMVNWHNQHQYRALHAGAWETNYINPEFEPGMFASPRDIEYRTLGVTGKYNFEASRIQSGLENRDVDPGEIERNYIFGIVRPLEARPKGEEGQRFDRDVVDKTLNTANSPEYRNALVRWRKDGISKQRDYQGKENTSALLYLTPNDNKLRLEEEFASDPQNTSTWKTSRHQFAKNVGATEEQQQENLVAVQPLREGLIEGPDATSVEKSIREESRIWGEYARVRGDEQGGFKIRE